MLPYLLINLLDKGIVMANTEKSTASTDPMIINIGINTNRQRSLQISPQSLIQPVPMQGAAKSPIRKATTAPKTIIKAIATKSKGKSKIMPTKFFKACFLVIDYVSLKNNLSFPYMHS